MPAMPVLNRCKHVDQMFSLIPGYVVRWWSSWDTEEPVSKDRGKKTKIQAKIKKKYMQNTIYMCIKTYIYTYLYTAYSTKVIIIDIGSYIYLLLI